MTSPARCRRHWGSKVNTMIVKRDSAPTVNKTQDQLQWAAGYYLTPSRLAGQRVKSYAAAMVAGLTVAGAAYIGFEYDLWLPMLPARWRSILRIAAITSSDNMPML